MMEKMQMKLHRNEVEHTPPRYLPVFVLLFYPPTAEAGSVESFWLVGEEGVQWLALKRWVNGAKVCERVK